MRKVKKIVGVIALAIAAIYAYIEKNPELFSLNKDRAEYANSAIREAFENKRSDVQVSGSGLVTRILADDNDGSRHQRFILELDSGLTLLIAHNIDLAPRIDNLSRGDQVDFYGEYEWNQNGGVVHWTHLDPRGSHPHGWLKHQGKTYE